MWALIVLLMQEDGVTLPAEKSDLVCPGLGRGHRGCVPREQSMHGEAIMSRDWTQGAASLRS